LLFYDKRKDGVKGRALLQNVVEVGLLKGDRLEPSSLMTDVAAFEEMAVPFSCLFWRVSEETFAKHRNPLFSVASGVSLDNIGIDWLHALSLGVFQTYLANLVWDLVEANVYGIAGPIGSRLELSVVALRSQLWLWYNAEAKEGRQWTRVQGITAKMMGSRYDRALKLHGSETNGFLMFADTLLEKHKVILGPSYGDHRKGLSALLVIYRLIKEHHDTNFPPAAIQEFCNNVCLHMQALTSLEIAFKPKHHMLLEMGARFQEIPTYSYPPQCRSGLSRCELK
jgi:hypothetical protein